MSGKWTWMTALLEKMVWVNYVTNGLSCKYFQASAILWKRKLTMPTNCQLRYNIHWKPNQHTNSIWIDFCLVFTLSGNKNNSKYFVSANRKSHKMIKYLDASSSKDVQQYVKHELCNSIAHAHDNVRRNLLRLRMLPIVCQTRGAHRPSPKVDFASPPPLPHTHSQPPPILWKFHQGRL